MQTETLSAGPELDVLVAERIMGWRREMLYDQEVDPGFFDGSSKTMYRVVGQRDYLVPPDWPGGAAGARGEINGLVIGGDIPPYSTDIAAAYAVLDAVIAMPSAVKRWFYAAIKDEIMHDRIGGWLHRRADHPAIICRAALRAVGAEDGSSRNE